MTQSGYFRLVTAVELGMGTTDRKILFCHGISEGRVENKFPMGEYNNRTVYDCLNNHFPDDCSIPDFNLPHITIDNRTRPHKISRYTPAMLTATIYVASENSVSTLTTTYDFP